MTFNKLKNEFFLLKEINISEVGDSSINTMDELETSAYEKMKEYVETIINCVNSDKPNEEIGNSYTVEWCKHGEPTHKSFFYGKTIEEVMGKFYFGKEEIKDLFTVYDVKLNPVA